MLVVDEAHYVKNSAAKRSQTIRALTERAGRVLFLTGTPMENRAEEFRVLIGYLQPQLAGQLGQGGQLLAPMAFRHQAAPAYLRRNTADVLTELPELIRIDEREEYGPAELAAYWKAVREGNFMAMRRAAYPRFGAPAGSVGKLPRLIEITEEATSNGLKVVVFSFFRDVLDVVRHALASSLGATAAVFGPLTGDVPASSRLNLVDQFTTARGPVVLVSQIEAGGVGLNMQAASVVILCEPQLKPSTEEQAIARCHRMGQVRGVRVHRLLSTEGVDPKLLDMLSRKRQEFDAYARHSAVAQSSPDAVDISEVELARRIVEEEQIRLAMQDART